MRFGLCAGLVIVQNDHGRFIRVRLSVFPALHRSTHEFLHIRDKGGIIQTLFQDIKPVFQRCHALVFIFEGHQIVRADARINDLPIFIIGHGRNTVSLTLQQRVHVKALLEHLNTGFRFAIRGNAQLAHPGHEGEFITKEPHAQRPVGQICWGRDPRIAPTGQHHARGFERLCDVHQGQTLFACRKCGGHPLHRHVRTATGNDLRGRNIRTTGQDCHVQPLFLIKPFVERDIIARKLRLCDPFQLQLDLIRKGRRRQPQRQRGACQ